MSVSAQTSLHFLMNYLSDLLCAKARDDASSEKPRAFTRDELIEVEEDLQRALRSVRRERETIARWYRQDCCECGRHTEYLVSDTDIHPTSGPFGDLPSVCYQCWSQKHPDRSSRWEELTRFPYYEPLEIGHRERMQERHVHGEELMS